MAPSPPARARQCVLLLFVVTWFTDAALFSRADAEVGGDLIDFDTQIVPVLTKFGCNSGACHGAAAGRGGFSLSLFGSRPADDFEAITEHLEGRRVNLVAPQQSLLVLKATGQLDHGGDVRFDEDSPAADRLLGWIQQGASRNPNAEIPVAKVEITMTGTGTGTGTVVDADADSMDLQSIPAVQPIAQGRIQVWIAAPVKESNSKLAGHSATAEESATDHVAIRHSAQDFIRQDVTEWAVLTADDPQSVWVESSGQFTVLHPGQHIVMARYLNQVLPVTLMVPVNAGDPQGGSSANAVSAGVGAAGVQQSEPSASGSETQQLPGQDRTSSTAGLSADLPNDIDHFIDLRLSQLNLTPAAPATDAAFLRRLTLDIAGRLPTAKEQQQFIENKQPDKRISQIDRLLSSPDFVSFWTFRLGQMLRLGQSREEVATSAFHAWIASHLRAGKGMDLLVRELILAQGSINSDGATYFYHVAENAREQAEFFSEALLGVRLRCANCHDHPFDRWTQDDYHGLAAIFARVQRGAEIRYTERGFVVHPGTGLTAVPRIPGQSFLNAEDDGRKALLAWMLDDGENRFAKAFVNRVWASLMGRGLVDPIDDLRVTNPSTHPELWLTLSQQFKESGYDLQWLVRRICQSRAYGRHCSKGSKLQTAFYASRSPGKMAPHVLLDAVYDVVQSAAIPDDGEGAADQKQIRITKTVARQKAIAMSNPLAASAELDALGRCSTAKPCNESLAGSGVSDLTLPLSLHLTNGALLNSLLPEFARQLTNTHGTEDPGQLVVRVYRTALCRSPSSHELQFWRQQLSASAEERSEFLQVVEDFAWAVLTSDEFMTIR